MPSKLLALVLTVVAVACGAGAISIFSGGERPLWLLGMVLGLGAVGLLALAARVYAGSTPPARNRSGLVRYSRGQRLALIGLAVVAFTFGAHDLATGEHKSKRSSIVTREKQPGEFWQMVLVYFGTGGFLVYLGNV